MVLVDSNRRDLIYCMHEYSTMHEKQTFRWTKNSEAKITKERKLRKLIQYKKPIESKKQKCFYQSFIRAPSRRMGTSIIYLILLNWRP